MMKLNCLFSLLSLGFFSFTPSLVDGSSLQTTDTVSESSATNYFPIICNIIQVDVEYQQDTSSHQDDSPFVCLADTLERGRDQAYGIDLSPSRLQKQIGSLPDSSISIAISKVSFDHSNTTILIADDAEIAIEASSQQGYDANGDPQHRYRRRRRRRRLAATKGVSKVLVVRVTNRGKAPSITSKQLAGRVFGIGSAAVNVNLVSQMRACSFGKLRFVPATGSGIENGVAEISIGEAVSGDFSVRNLENLAISEANRRFGTVSLLANHVILVMPSGLQ